jgi:hypothetical protein
MKPSIKSEAIETAIQDIFGHDRREAIYQNKCVPKPIGCGKEVVPELWDALTQKEFSISGLCADCQDSVFDTKSNQFNEPDPLTSEQPKPREFYTPTENDYVVQRQPMRSGQGEAQSRKYHKYIGSNGRIWLVADQENAAANVYVEGSIGSDGFGGATLTFPLVEGGEIELRGPWHSNSNALYEATGVDVRDKTYTFVVVSRERKSGEHYEMIMADVLYKDEAPMLGTIDRGKEIARGLLASLSLDSVALYSASEGGSSCGFEYAEGREPRHCKQCMNWHPEGNHITSKQAT